MGGIAGAGLMRMLSGGPHHGGLFGAPHMGGYFGGGPVFGVGEAYEDATKTPTKTSEAVTRAARNKAAPKGAGPVRR